MTTDEETAGLHPYGLEVPRKSLASAMMEPRPCRVCGRTRRPFDRCADDAHEACREQEQGWWDAANRIRAHDEPYAAAEQVIAEAEAKRDRVYREVMAAAGIPAWFADQQVQYLYDD